MVSDGPELQNVAAAKAADVTDPDFGSPTADILIYELKLEDDGSPSKPKSVSDTILPWCPLIISLTSFST